jgi:hypothetical protein
VSYARRADRIPQPEKLRIISTVADGDNRNSEDPRMGDAAQRLAARGATVTSRAGERTKPSEAVA